MSKLTSKHGAEAQHKWPSARPRPPGSHKQNARKLDKPKNGALLLVLLLLLLLVHRTAADERQLLMQIKHTWGDPPVLAAWSNGSESGDHCSWPYVTCDVTGLSLANTKVAGPFPAAIGGLSGLTSLNLFNNSLTGAFPTSVYRCASLRHLDLSYNYFHGELPASIGRALGQNLTSLMLNGDCFTGAIPTSLSRLRNLQTLELDNNYLAGTIPPELGDLTLGYNEFDVGELPASFRNLTKLKILRARSCNLTGDFPGYVTEMPELLVLDLSFNALTGSIPHYLRACGTSPGCDF
ncbi:Leucine-rich repeat receptor-like protein kinase PXL2 [Hordeum vulgare]|nr:Leucine-rich repeat receptor-like protein kinase PXL2 [Hordeum vulgare]